jgi:adenylyltransferase/sulfurtransferase
LHREADIGRDKVASARDALLALNHTVEIETFPVRLDAEKLASILHDADGNTVVDLVVDACDNFSTRFMINRACIASSLPLVSGAAIRMEGQVAVFDTRHEASPCYQCLYQEGDDEQMSCARNGVMSPLVGLIGSYQALEAIKVLSDMGRNLSGRLQIFDGMSSQWRELKLTRDPACPACASRPMIGQK